MNTESMFSVKELMNSFCPLGYLPKSIDVVDTTSLETIYQANFQTRYNPKDQYNSNSLLNFSVSFSIPLVLKEFPRVFLIESSSGIRNRIVSHVAHPDISDISGDSLVVISWKRTVINALNNVASDALMSYHHGGDLPAEDTITYRFYNWLNTSPIIYDVDINNAINFSSVSNIVNIQFLENGIDHNARKFREKWIGLLDPCSTPTTSKINTTYRLSKGATIKNSKIVSDLTHIFCDITEQHGIAMHLNPRRSYLLRNTIENSCQIIDEFNETPLLSNAINKNDISGVHLLTAVCTMKTHTFEDSIAISETAANRMQCYVDKQQTLVSVESLTSLVNVGDVIHPRDYIANNLSGELYRENKLYLPAQVINIESFTTIKNGIIVNCLRFSYQSIYNLVTGDKISNRGCSKGVVVVLPDDQMPLLETGERVDICISTEAIAKRRIMSLYWEMMAHKALKASIPVDPSNYCVSPNFQQLATEFGLPSKATLEGKEVNIFTGYVYWLRLNKHAIENFNWVPSHPNHQSVNSFGLAVDSAKVSGQRFDMAKLLAFHDRDQVFYDIYKNRLKTHNVSFAAVDKWMSHFK